MGGQTDQADLLMEAIPTLCTPRVAGSSSPKSVRHKEPDGQHCLDDVLRPLVGDQGLTAKDGWSATRLVLRPAGRRQQSRMS